ncbi:MAG: DUF222 domain-containing protein, partial [Propionibacteriaceae bacterium]|nr:DUF222 domain-containing protein [Propionibacteriaceae bacterium]
MMMVLGSLADALAALDHATAEIRAGEVAQMIAIARACDLYQITDHTIVEGSERLVRLGGDGTPLVGEFLTAEIAPLLGVGIDSARRRIASVLNLRHRHPVLWHHATTGAIPCWQALLVADQCHTAGLSAAACSIVDGHCATALAFQPWTRVRRQIDRWIIAAAPELAAQHAHDAAQGRRVTIHPIVDGHTDLTGRLDPGDGIALDDALDQIAGALPSHL